MKARIGTRTLVSAFLAVAIAAVPFGLASATGTARIQQRDGSTKTYTNVRIDVTTESMAITSSDGQGTLVFGKAACTKVGELLRCIPYDATLEQHGQIDTHSAPIWNGLAQSERHHAATHPFLDAASAPRRAVVNSNKGRDLCFAYRRRRSDSKMNAQRIAALALLLFLVPLAADARGGGGRTWRRLVSRGGGGFDMHGDTAAAHPPQTASHSSTGPAGTSRTTTATSSSNGYARSTTATNGNASRTSYGAASSNGNYSHGSSGSNGYASHSSSTSGNTNSGNYNHSGSGSTPYGSYSDSGSGNAHSNTYSGSGTGTNAYGQTYHSSTYANNGTVYHGATVTNPVYGYPVYGWNGGYPWYPAPYYYGGGFWGPFAVGVTSAAVYGSIVAANNQTITSYQVETSSPGAKLLESYHLTQTACGPPGLVVIYGPNNSVICADPNNLVSAGNYSVNSQTLTIVSEKPAPKNEESRLLKTGFLYSYQNLFANELLRSPAPRRSVGKLHLHDTALRVRVDIRRRRIVGSLKRHHCPRLQLDLRRVRNRPSVMRSRSP